MNKAHEIELNTYIIDIPWIPVRIANQLSWEKAQMTLRDLLTLTNQQLLRRRNVGRSSVGVLNRELAKHGYTRSTKDFTITTREEACKAAFEARTILEKVLKIVHRCADQLDTICPE